MSTNQSHADLRSKMFSKIENYLASGQTQKQFCQENNLSFAKFTYWLKKYRDEKSQSSGFIPLKVSNQKIHGDCRIELPNGVNVILNGSGNKELISGLISQAAGQNASY